MNDLITRLLALAEKAVDEALQLDYGDPDDRYIYRELQELRQLVQQRAEGPDVSPLVVDQINTLRLTPPAWLNDEEIKNLPDALTDKRELWEMVATCSPWACISAHYSSLVLRVVADWLQCRAEQAEINGWDYPSWRLVSDLRLAANAADAAIDACEIMPRQICEVQ